MHQLVLNEALQLRPSGRTCFDVCQFNFCQNLHFCKNRSYDLLAYIPR